MVVNKIYERNKKTDEEETPPMKAIDDKIRIQWVDVLKGVTVVLVALHHSILSSSTINIQSFNTDFDAIIITANELLGYARMSAFFLAGGIVLASVKSEKLSWFLKKRLPFMLWIIFVWTLISYGFEYLGVHLYPWESYPFFKEWNFTIAPYAPYGHLWFIYALLFLSTFAVAMSYFPMILQILFTVFISYAFNYRLSNGEFQYSITHHLFEMLAFRGLPFFMMGFIFKNEILRFFASGRNILIVMPILIIVSLFIYFEIKGNSEVYKLFFRYAPSTFFFVSGVVFVSKIELVKKVFGRIGALSLEVFLLHQFFIALTYFIYNHANLQWGYVFTKIFMIIFPVMLCIGFVFCCGRNINSIFFTVPKILTPKQ